MVLYLLPYEHLNNTDDEYADLSPSVLLVYIYFFVRQICLIYISQQINHKDVTSIVVWA